MAIKIAVVYPNAEPVTASYPGGSFKNETSPGALDGTPLEKAWADDLIGFRDAILAAAARGYSGAPDTALLSDALEALYTLFVKQADAVSAATASKVMKRDVNGRSKVVAGVASDDVATLGQLDTHAGLTAPHSASQTATALRMAQRDSAGRLEGATAVAGNDLVNFTQWAASLGVGVGQAWATAALFVDTQYQNLTGKPIMVSVRSQNSGGSGVNLSFGLYAGPSSADHFVAGGTATLGYQSACGIIPASHFYKVTGFVASVSILS